MKKRGSAIIIAMLLLAGVGTVAFGISRLLFLETSKAVLYENGIPAYYAAESGIEEAFLRYKFNHNAAIPPITTTGGYLDSNNAYQSTLIDGSVNTGAALAGINPTALLSVAQQSQQIYQLRMGYLGTPQSNGIIKPWFGRDFNGDGYLTTTDYYDANYVTADYAALKVEQDNTLKVDMSNVGWGGDNRFYLELAFDNITSDVDKCFAIAELKLAFEGTLPMEYKDLATYSPANCALTLGIAQGKLLGQTGTENYDDPSDKFKYRIDLDSLYQRAGKTYAGQYSSGKVILTIKTLYKPAKVGIFTGLCNPPSPTSPRADCVNTDGQYKAISGPFTYITSVGHYGGVTRTLTANIDRQSGTLYDLFDYVIYKEN